MRLFIACGIDDACRERVRDFADTFCAGIAGVRRVQASAMHVTLAFLGEHPGGAVSRIDDALRQSTDGMRQFEVFVGSVGIFPLQGCPKVLWIGLHDAEGLLAQLARRLHTALDLFGIAHDAKEFTPHLTIGRIKDITPRVKDMLIRKVIEHGNAACGSFRAVSARLIESRLSRSGPLYTVVKEHFFAK